jgi:DnaJ-domain-containing protein 1
MARTKVVNGVRMNLTPEEETARDAEEAAWASGAFDREIARLRDDRNRRLSATDWYALQDVGLSDAMTAYRQDLRDLPAGLSTVAEVKAVSWPVKP